MLKDLYYYDYKWNTWEELHNEYGFTKTPSNEVTLRDSDFNIVTEKSIFNKEDGWFVSKEVGWKSDIKSENLYSSQSPKEYLKDYIYTGEYGHFNIGYEEITSPDGSLKLIAPIYFQGLNDIENTRCVFTREGSDDGFGIGWRFLKDLYETRGVTEYSCPWVEDLEWRAWKDESKDPVLYWDDEYRDKGWSTEYPESLALNLQATANNTTVKLLEIGASHGDYEYSLDGTVWQPYTSGTTITLNNIGDKVYFAGLRTSNQNTNEYITFNISGSVKVRGNCTSLLDKDRMKMLNITSYPYAFYKLFYNCGATELDISKLRLSPEWLSSYAYAYMFAYTNIEEMCELKAEYLEDSCYSSMFYNCSNLHITKPLPATTLKRFCYSSMFNHCTSLEEPPEMHFTTTDTASCMLMFSGCSKLASMPELRYASLAERCYERMFLNCTELKTAVLLDEDINKEGCYSQMFSGCSNLSYVLCWAKVINPDCCDEWLRNVSPTGTFVREPSAIWDIGESGIPTGWEIQPEYDYTKLPLTISSSDPLSITINKVGDEFDEYEYSLDNREWKPVTPDQPIEPDTYYKIISFRGTRTTVQNASNYITLGLNHKDTSSEAPIKVFGNCESLLTHDYATLSISSSYKFYRLFYSQSKLTDASNLKLPDLNLFYSDHCYQEMFCLCSKLTKAPELPATGLSDYCYYRIFAGCYKLVEAPDLIATDLKILCYREMFNSCNSLVKAPPTLPATTLTTQCYAGMFFGCSNLTKAPDLPATDLASSCYYQMFQGCSKLAEAPDLPATTLAVTCYRQMFQGCKSLINAPELPATQLVTSCYRQMFYGCENLNYVKCLATYLGATDCILEWLKDVSSTGTFVRDADTKWERGESGIPTDWEVDPPMTGTVVKMGFSWPLNSFEAVIPANTIYTRYPLLVSQRGGTGYDYDYISYPLGLAGYTNPDEHYLKVIKAFDGMGNEIDATNLSVVSSPSTDMGNVYLRNTGNTQIRVSYIYVETQILKLRQDQNRTVSAGSPVRLYAFSSDSGNISCNKTFFPDIQPDNIQSIPVKFFLMDGTPVDETDVILYLGTTYIQLASTRATSKLIGYVEFDYPWSAPL